MADDYVHEGPYPEASAYGQWLDMKARVEDQAAEIERLKADLAYAEARIRNQEKVVEANLETLIHAQRRFERSELEKAELLAQLEQRPRPVRMRHAKRGTTYELIGVASVQSDSAIHEDDQLMVYRGEDGVLWARLLAEFGDGRFVPVIPGE